MSNEFETNELLQVRLEKLHTLEEMGVDPFGHRFDL